jgi:hypothetical protein
MRRYVLPSKSGTLFGLEGGVRRGVGRGLNHSDKHNLKLQDLRSKTVAVEITVF